MAVSKSTRMLDMSSSDGDCCAPFCECCSCVKILWSARDYRSGFSRRDDVSWVSIVEFWTMEVMSPLV
jgi:hypothetical protein